VLNGVISSLCVRVFVRVGVEWDCKKHRRWQLHQIVPSETEILRSHLVSIQII